MSALEDHIAELSAVCAGLPDRRKGPLPGGAYTMADIGLSAFSLFFMGSPSFLAHQRALAEGQGRSNCQTLFGISAIPSDNYIRQMLDGAPTAAFDPLFLKAIETPGVLAPFQRLGGRILIALDGTEHHCSRKVHCARCSTRQRSDGGTEYFHAFLGASIVAPGHQHVLPLPPEFIVPQDGAEKQDCERNAAKRWLARHGASLAHAAAGLSRRRSVRLPADRRGHPGRRRQFHPDLQAQLAPDHQRISAWRQAARAPRDGLKRGKRTTTIYRWLADVPLRDSADALAVNWFSIEMFNAKGKRTYHNSFVTDLPVTAGTVAELRRLRPGALEDRERDVQCPQVRRLQPRAQFRPRQGNAGQRAGGAEPAGVRLPHRRHSGRPGLARRRSPRRAQHTGSSSTCGRSPHTSCSRTGRICCAPSPQADIRPP